MRAIGAVALAAMLGGCTTTRILQRDGCWVRQTKRVMGSTTEELGPCMRQQPQWASDRLTRLVQECVAAADHRWTVAAIDAWNRRQPLPRQEPEREVIRTCLDQASGGVVTQNETLRERLAEVSSDRAALAAKTAETDAHLRASNDKLAEFLGEAAKRPPPVATATATSTSDGTATTDSGLTAETGTSSQAAPAAAAPVAAIAAPPLNAAPPPVTTAAAPGPDPGERPAVKVLQRARAARKARQVRKASLPACDPASAAADAKPADGQPADGKPAPEAKPAADAGERR
jgi:hypothetical protein